MSLAFVLSFVALAAVSIGPAISDEPVAVNLDRDPAPEHLLYHELRPGVVQAQVRDHCDGVTRTWPLSPREQKFETLRAVEMDGVTPQPEVFIWATGSRGAQFLEVVRFDQRPGECSRPRMLLRFRAPARPRCGRGTTVSAHLVRAAGRTDGRDVRVRLLAYETCHGHFRVGRRFTRLYRYDVRLDRYIATG